MTPSRLRCNHAKFIRIKEINMLIKYKISGAKTSYKYNIFNFKRLNVNLIVLHKDDYTDWHDHPLTQFSMLLKGKYVEEVLEEPIISEGPVIYSDTTVHKYPGSCNVVNVDDYHRIRGIKGKSYILSIGVK